MYSKKELEDLIDEWHRGVGAQPLHEFLGWSWDEYRHWVYTNRQPNAEA